MKDRISNCELVEAFDMGSYAVSDFVTKQPENLERFPLKFMFSPESKLLQLSESVDTSSLYGRYWYRSGTNESMKLALKDIVDDIVSVYRGPKEYWVDVAANDGTLLSYVPPSYYRIGIDPADNTYSEQSSKIAHQIIQDFFCQESWEKTLPSLMQKRANIITAIAMFYDLDDPETFLRNIFDALDDNGLFVLQMSYTPLMVEQMAIDNACHEHVTYYTLESLQYILNKTGFKIMDVKLNEVNGGSFRIFIQKKIASSESFGSACYRDCAKIRVESLRDYEAINEVNTLEYYQEFWRKCLLLKDDIVDLVAKIIAEDKSIYLLGASTKGNTLLQWLGLTDKFVAGASERSPYKHGLRTIATNIPIYSEEIVRAMKPDYLFVLPWHFADELLERERSLFDSGTRFIFPCPKLKIVGNNK